MLSSVALLDLATARAWVPEFASVDDADVERLINSASELANQYSHRVLRARDVTEYVSVHGDTCGIVLENRPIGSVTSVTVSTTWSWDEGTAVTDYQISESAGVLHRRITWPRGNRHIRVIYRAGYELAEVPADLQQAVCEVMAWTQRRIVGKQIGLSSHSFGDESVSYELTPPVSAQRVFEAYRDVRVA